MQTLTISTSSNEIPTLTSPSPNSQSSVSVDNVKSTIPPVFEASQNAKPQNQPAPSPSPPVKQASPIQTKEPSNTVASRAPDTEAQQITADEPSIEEQQVNLRRHADSKQSSEKFSSTQQDDKPDIKITNDKAAIEILLEQKAQVETLAIRDREVRSHERSHRSTGGSLAESSSVSFKQGADGVKYASSGDVSIDVSPVEGDPLSTIKKMRVVQQSASAPAEPSASDRAVVTAATRTLVQAQNELVAQKSEGIRQDEAQASEKRATIRAQQNQAIKVYTQLNAIGVETENSKDIESLLPKLNLNVYA